MLLVAACGGEEAPPRELPSPDFEARELFTELAAADGDETTDTGHVENEPSAFDRALRNPRPQNGGREQEPAEEDLLQRRIPLGANLVAVLPAEGSAWRWSTESGATLILHGTGRPDALVYTETFADRMQERPSAELKRFQFTVNPEGFAGPSVSGSLARLFTAAPSGDSESGNHSHRSLSSILRATATAGRGLGFTPGADESFTGLRWVGTNEHGVLLRFGRQGGFWQDQQPISDRLRSALGGAEGAISPRPSSTETLGRVSAHLLIGNAQEPDGTFGAHIAVLCARVPECPVAAELADLLDSIRVEAPGRVRRLRKDFRPDFDDLARSAGLDTLVPGNVSGDPATRP